MNETPEPRELFPLVVFNRPSLGMTAGQKEGIIPRGHSAQVQAFAENKVIDFRPKPLPADVELPTPTKEPAGDDEDPKVADSSVTDSASESGGVSSETTTPQTQTPASTESQTSQSEPPADPAFVEKDAPQTSGPSLARTIGGSEPPVVTTGVAPSVA